MLKVSPNPAIWREGDSFPLPSLESVCEQAYMDHVLPTWVMGDQSQWVHSNFEDQAEKWGV